MRPSNLYFALPVLKTFSQLTFYDTSVHVGFSFHNFCR